MSFVNVRFKNQWLIGLSQARFDVRLIHYRLERRMGNSLVSRDQVGRYMNTERQVRGRSICSHIDHLISVMLELIRFDLDPDRSRLVLVESTAKIHVPEDRAVGPRAYKRYLTDPLMPLGFTKDDRRSQIALAFWEHGELKGPYAIADSLNLPRVHSPPFPRRIVFDVDVSDAGEKAKTRWSQEQGVRPGVVGLKTELKQLVGDLSEDESLSPYPYRSRLALGK
jgi:hypothetical protein